MLYRAFARALRLLTTSSGISHSRPSVVWLCTRKSTGIRSFDAATYCTYDLITLNGTSAQGVSHLSGNRQPTVPAKPSLQNHATNLPPQIGF